MFVLAASSAAAAAHAEDAGSRAGAPAARRFGGRGQVALDNVIGVTTEGGYLGPGMIAGAQHDTGWGATGYTGVLGYTFSDARRGELGGYSAGTRTAWVSPSVDVFVTDRVSIGATIGLSYHSREDVLPGDGGATTSSKSDAFTFSAVPRVGYAIALGEPLTLWPRAGFGYSGTSAHLAWAGGTEQSMDAWIGVVDVGLVYRPTEHVYLHMAPELVMRLSSAKGSGGAIVEDHASLRLGFTGGLGILLSS